jgi:hypothetical protein
MSSNPAPIDKAAVDVANNTTTNNNMAPITATTNSNGKDGDIPQDGTVVSIGLEADEDELSYLRGHGAEDDDDGDGYEFDGMVITSEEIGESTFWEGNLDPFVFFYNSSSFLVNTSDSLIQGTLPISLHC